MPIVAEFRIDPDYRARAVSCVAQIVEAMRVPGPYTEDQRVEWEMLERAGLCLIAAARAVDHPIGVHSPEFWPVWNAFVERNARIDEALRGKIREEGSAAFSGMASAFLALAIDLTAIAEAFEQMRDAAR